MTPIWFIHSLADDPRAEDDYALIEMHTPPGDQPPLHVHRDEDEGFYVLEGELCLWAGEERILLRPGQFANAPAGVPHTYRVVGEEPARYLVTSPTGAVRALRAGVRGAGAERRELPSVDGPAGRRAPRRAWPPSTGSTCSALPGCSRPTSTRRAQTRNGSRSGRRSSSRASGSPTTLR